jgi:hypothetical protein
LTFPCGEGGFVIWQFIYSWPSLYEESIKNNIKITKEENNKRRAKGGERKKKTKNK